jgi:U3 small nucleolar RNA-associated protein 7
MPRVLESSTTRVSLPEDKDRIAQIKKHPFRTTKTQQLDEIDRKVAEKNIQLKKENEKKYEEEIKQQKRKERQEIAKSKPLLDKNRNIKAYKDMIKQNRKELLRKYVRPKFRVSKKNQGYFQVVSMKKNRYENVRKAALSDRDNAIAELKLMETEILRNINVPSGIELEESDIFSSTDQIAQNYLIDNVDLVSQKKVFDLLLEKGGPYQLQYTISGRTMLLAGHSGHIASVKWNTFDLVHETETEQPIYAIQWMMDDSMYAVAQQLRTYVFNDKGIEIHSMHDFHKVRYLSYLPFHFLLVGATRDTNLIYKDISIGKNVANIQFEPTHCIAPNHYNALMCLGHSNGQVSMVTPRDHNKKPVVSMFCHKGPVKHIAVDPTGQFLVTASMDNTAKVWDIRKTYQPLCTVNTPSNVSALTISQTGMAALGYADAVIIWKHTTYLNKRAYLKHKLPIGIVRSLDFCPYEDVLGIGHTKGMSSILIPGSGQQNYDSRLPNPYSTEKQIKDYNVRSLLEKIPYDMITLNPAVIGTSGQLEKVQSYNENVEMTEDLKEQLNNIGVYDKDQIAKKRKLIDSRDGLREELYKQNEELKSSVPENWWEDKKPDALDRFASIKKRKIKNENEEAQSELDDDSGTQDNEIADLEREEMEVLKFLNDSDDETDQARNELQVQKKKKIENKEEEEEDDEDEAENGDANLLDGLADSDSGNEHQENGTTMNNGENVDPSGEEEGEISSDDGNGEYEVEIIDPFA